MAGCSCQDNLINDTTGFIGVFFQENHQRIANGAGDNTCDLRVAQLAFSLPLKLRFRHLDRHHSRETFPKIFSGDFKLKLFKHATIFPVLGKYAGERPAEAGNVRTSLPGIDIVDERVNVFRERSIVLYSDFHLHILLLSFYPDRFIDKLGLALVQIKNKLAQSTFGIKILAPCLLFVIGLALICKTQPQPGIEVGHLPQTRSQNVILELGCFENGVIRPEGNGCTRAVRLANNFDLAQRFAYAVLLFENFSLAMYLHTYIGRQCIDAGNTHPVQTARHLIGIFVKFTPGVQHRHDHFEG